MQPHILKMIDLITWFGQLDFIMDGELSQNITLQSLLDSFPQFIINYRMNKQNTTRPEIFNMLKIVESHFKDEKAPILFVDEISRKEKVGKKGLKKKKKLNRKVSISKKLKAKIVSTIGSYFHYKRTCIGRGTTKSILQAWSNKKRVQGLHLFKICIWYKLFYHWIIQNLIFGYWILLWFTYMQIVARTLRNQED